MLSWFRARARRLSGLGLVSLGVLTFASAVPHQDDHHGERLDLFARHDPNGHAVRGPSGDEGQPPFHCVLCHLTRAVGRPDATTPLPAPVAHDRARALPTAFRVPSRHEAVQPPLRAPPRHA